MSTISTLPAGLDVKSYITAASLADHKIARSAHTRFLAQDCGIVTVASLAKTASDASAFSTKNIVYSTNNTQKQNTKNSQQKLSSTWKKPTNGANFSRHHSPLSHTTK